MRRTFRVGVLLGLFVLAGLAFPSRADAQRRGGGGGARGGGAVRTSGTAVHGGGAVYRGGGQVAVPRTRPPYSSSYYRPYYSHPYYRPYYYRPYYSGYYPYYSPWSFGLSFGVGWYGGYYAPYYAYPYPAPYVASPPPSAYPSSYADNGFNTTVSSPSRADDRGEFGTLSLRVMPADATILIDQQAWDRPREDERFSIELVQGPHLVEIRKAGYATYVGTIEVPRGQSVVVNVALTTGGSGTVPVARTVPLRHQ